MTDLQRWLQSGEAPDGVADLLAVARPPRPLDAVTRARSRRRIAAMTAIPAAAGVVFWVKSVALGAVLGSVVTVAVVVPQLRAPQSASVAVPVIRTNKQSQPVAKVPEAPAVQEEQPEPSAEPSAAPTVMAPSPNSSRAAPAVTAVASDNLGREIQLLERARQLLKVNPALAMTTLDEHRKEFGSGTLVLERQFLEVEALLRLGRRDQAVARAADLRARAPGSLYERRLTQLLGSD